MSNQYTVCIEISVEANNMFEAEDISEDLLRKINGCIDYEAWVTDILDYNDDEK